jgi:hypothetical protein
LSVGSEGYHFLAGMSTNTARPQVCSDPMGCLSSGIRPANQAVRVPQGTTYMPSVPPVGVGIAQLQMRPNPFVGSTLTWFYNGTNNYQSGNVSLTKRSSRGLTFKANYTFAKILDINSAILAASATNEPANVLNPFDLSLSRGLASFNLKHQFNATFFIHCQLGTKYSEVGNGVERSIFKVVSRSRLKWAPMLRALATL